MKYYVTFTASRVELVVEPVLCQWRVGSGSVVGQRKTASRKMIELGRNGNLPGLVDERGVRLRHVPRTFFFGAPSESTLAVCCSRAEPWATQPTDWPKTEAALCC